MSCKLLTHTIQPQILADIQKQLHLVPKENFFQQKQKQWKAKYVRQEDPDEESTTQPIDFYYQDQLYTYLPLTFASSYFHTTFNTNIPYPKYSWQFTGELLQRQVDVATEAWDIMYKSGSVILGLYPGFGKTVLASYLSSKAGLLTCVMICLEALIDQWVKTFRTFTNARVWVVGEPIPAEFDVIICMDRRWQYISPETREKVGTLVIDEAHMFCAPVRSSCFMAFQPLYTLPLTATIEREDGMEQLIYAVSGAKGIFRESDKPFQVIKINTGIQPVRKQNKMGWTDYAALQRDIAVHPRRNGIIVDLVKRNLNFKILILTTLVDHTKIIYHGLIQHGVNTDYLIGGKRGYLDSNVLVGTMGKLGTGFDAATACPDYQGRPFDLLIIAATIKQIKMLTQNVGRVFRSEFPTVMHLVDDDSTYQRHWKGDEKWYHNRYGIVSQLTISLHMPVPNINIPQELLDGDTSGNSSDNCPGKKGKKQASAPRYQASLGAGLVPYVQGQPQYQQPQYQQPSQYIQSQYIQPQYTQSQYYSDQQQCQQPQYLQQGQYQPAQQQYLQHQYTQFPNASSSPSSSSSSVITAFPTPVSHSNPFTYPAEQVLRGAEYRTVDTGPLSCTVYMNPMASQIYQYQSSHNPPVAQHSYNQSPFTPITAANTVDNSINPSFRFI